MNEGFPHATDECIKTKCPKFPNGIRNTNKNKKLKPPERRELSFAHLAFFFRLIMMIQKKKKRGFIIRDKEMTRGTRWDQL
jgi:hypothetical protein